MVSRLCLVGLRTPLVEAVEAGFEGMIIAFGARAARGVIDSILGFTPEAAAAALAAAIEEEVALWSSVIMMGGVRPEATISSRWFLRMNLILRSDQTIQRSTPKSP